MEKPVGFFIWPKEEKDKMIYAHPGILDVLRMAIAEASAELIGFKINWLHLFD